MGGARIQAAHRLAPRALETRVEAALPRPRGAMYARLQMDRKIPVVSVVTCGFGSSPASRIMICAIVARDETDVHATHVVHVAACGSRCISS